MQNEKVSVVIPAYNRENTIERAVQSVLDQTYSNLEVIVVDDCSTDNTRYVVEKMAAIDKRISYYKLNENSGACVARNQGVMHSSGKIIAFQDSDDYWHKDKLNKQIDFLIKNNYEFISCGFNRITGSKKEKLGIWNCSSDKIKVWCDLLNHNWVSTQTVVCYKYCFDKIKFDPCIKRYQDWDLALQATHFYRVGSLNEYLVDVYLQENSITNVVKEETAKLAVVSKQKEFVNIKDKRMVAQYYKSIADVTRKTKPLKAGLNYWRSFMVKPKLKTLICCLLCLSGLIKFYNSRQ